MTTLNKLIQALTWASHAQRAALEFKGKRAGISAHIQTKAGTL
jgi:hypothetical protein